MDFADLLKEHGPQAGSDAHYAVAFTPKAKRGSLLALFALSQTLEHLGKTPKDLSLAQQQLHWWQGEMVVQRIAQSEHPYLRIMQAACQGKHRLSALSQALQSLTLAASDDLMQSRYLDRAALSAHLTRHHGAFAQALAVLCAGSDWDEVALNDLLEVSQGLGLAWGLGQVALQMAEDALSGHVYVPVADLQTASIRAHELIKYLTGQLNPEEQEPLIQPYGRLLQTHANWFESELQHGLGQASPEQLRLLKPLLILLSLTLKKLKDLHLKHALVGKPTRDLSPTHKFWLAWKMQALGRF